MRTLLVVVLVLVLSISLCTGRPYKNRKRSHHSKNSKKYFHNPTERIQSLMSSTPAVKEFDTVESFRKEKTGLQINEELEKRGRLDDNKHATIMKRNPFYSDMSDPQDTAEFDNFNQASPILWSNSQKNIARTEENPPPPPPPPQVPPPEAEGAPEPIAVEPHVTAEDSLDDMPNTVGPNPNIFGGFPENDIWGNFELPAPTTIDHLKLALKMSHHRPNYAGDQGSDANDQLYNYEHHALPEYDIMETPPFHEVLWQNAQLQEALKAGAKPACAPGMGSCPPVNAEVTCQNIHQACANNAQHPVHNVKFAPPCAAKILALFGCGKPKPPPKAKPPPPPEEPLPIPVKVKKPKDDDKDKKPDKPKDEKPDEGKKKGDPLVDFISDSLDDNTKNTGTDIMENIKAKKETQSRVGLLNPEQSLALMSAIGNDLEESLSETFHTDSKQTSGSNKNSDKVDDKFMGMQISSKSDNKPLKSNGKQVLFKVEKNEENTPDEDSRFSEWSIWTLCDHTCGEGMKSRRRTCLKQDCEGILEEKSSCILTKCSVSPVKGDSSDSSKVSETSSNENSENKESKEKTTEPISDPYASINKVITNKEEAEKSRNDEDNGMLRNAFENLLISRFSTEVLNNKSESQTDDSLGVHNVEKTPAMSDESSLKNSDSNSEQNNSESNVEQTKAESNTDQNKSDSNSEQHKSESNSEQSKEKEKENTEIPSASLEKKPTEEHDWGVWGACSTTCGIGLTTRQLYCGQKPCEGSEARTERKPCRQQACMDGELKDSLRKDCLSKHNELRRRHGAEPLQWSDNLYKKALEITDHLALKNVSPQNLTSYERPGLNLAYIPQQTNDDAAAPCTRAIDEWYGQKQNYNYEHPKLSAEDRDFAQLVWKATKQVGISKTKTLDGNTYIAAVYKPAGDIDSFYNSKKNVLPSAY